MNILVTGAKGQLGNAIKDIVEMRGNGKPDHFVGEPNHYIFVDVDELDITKEEDVAKFVKDNHINVIVNCAAYTNVERAQDDWETAYNVNAIGPMNLAAAAANVGAVLIHISTDYVFKGQRNTPVPPIPVGEDTNGFPDAERNECYYGYSKNVGEELIMRVSGARYIILRTAWLYSQYGKNFVKTMVLRAEASNKTSVVYDQTGSPTYAVDLARFIFHIIEHNGPDTPYLSKTGIYNFTNRGVASWYDLAWRTFVRFNGSDATDILVTPCRSDEYPSKVIRPAYSVLDIKKTEETFGYNIRHWSHALNEALEIISKDIREEKKRREQTLEAQNSEQG